jgi:hypothetical protein
MNDKQRKEAMEAADYAWRRIPNGSAAGDLRRASQGCNESLLLAVHLIIEYERRPPAVDG